MRASKGLGQLRNPLKCPRRETAIEANQRMEGGKTNGAGCEYGALVESTRLAGDQLDYRAFDSHRTKKTDAY
jgi:hypothetical protein